LQENVMSRRRRAIEAVFVVLVVLGGAIVPSLTLDRIPGLVASNVHDAATLPDRIFVCERDWKEDALNRQFSRAQIRAQFGIEPTAVDPGLFAHCPTGACTRVAQNGPCDTVVFVRVGEDAYLDYALLGGP
jgi:hypothetical protein